VILSKNTLLIKGLFSNTTAAVVIHVA
jgi:hypothetical protein